MTLQDILAQVLGFPIAAAGIAILFMTVRARVHARSDKGWRQVSATVTSSRLDLHRMNDRLGREHVSYRPVVEYTFMADGERVTSGTIYRGLRLYYVEREALAVIRPYPAGATVTAWTRVSRPASAVLDRTTANLFWPTLAGALMAVVGSALAVAPWFV